MTINTSNNYDYNAAKVQAEEMAVRRAYEVNSAKAIEAVKGVNNQEYYTPVESVEPVSYADTHNVDMSAATANLGNLTPEMEKLIFPAPTPTSSSPTTQQTSNEPRSTNSSDYNPAEEMREQVRAMRNTRPPESGESITATLSKEAASKPSPSEEIKEKFGVGSTEGRSDSDKVLNRVA